MSINFLTAPAPRLLLPLVLLGGGVLSATLLVRHHEPASPPAAAKQYQLLLSASTSPGCAWGSAWNDGDVVVGEERLGQTITLTRTFKFVDRCTWQATEVLSPGSDGEFAYSYEEHLVACDPDSTGPAMACTRSGFVTAAPLSGEAEELTALSGTTEASDPDAWGNLEQRCTVDTDDDDGVREDVEDVEDLDQDELTEG